VTTSLALGHVAVEARSEQLSPRYIEEASLLIGKEKSEYPLSPRDSQAGAQANIQSSQETVPAGFKMAKPARSPSSGIRRLLQERGPTISIVTPSFNQAEFLEATIDSILSQGYPRLEYAIIDGGSTDASLDIIKKYERHLTFWCSERDGGQYFAIQKGLARSMGEVMSWLNSDDKLVPHSLEYLALVFMLYPDIRWVSGRHGSILQSGAEEIGARATPLSREHYLREGFDNPFIQQEGTFWRRSLWHDAGGALDLKFSLAGDMDLWRRFFRHAALHRIDLPIGLFRVHPAQRSQLLQVQYYREAEDATREELALIQQGAFTQMIPAPPVLSESDILEAAERFVVGGGHAVQIFIKDLLQSPHTPR
jgi:hypothetical protein